MYMWRARKEEEKVTPLQAKLFPPGLASVLHCPTSSHILKKFLVRGFEHHSVDEGKMGFRYFGKIVPHHTDTTSLNTVTFSLSTMRT
jgi:hypothetical protein